VAAEWSALGALTAQVLLAHATAAAPAQRPLLAAAAADLTAWCSYGRLLAHSALQPIQRTFTRRFLN